MWCLREIQAGDDERKYIKYIKYTEVQVLH